MKLSMRGLLIGALGAAALSLSGLAVAHAQPAPPEIMLNSERVQIVHNGGGTSDYTNLNINFTNFGEDGCEGGMDDAIASGIEVALLGESCESFRCDANTDCADFITMLFPFDYFINPFVAHTVNHHTYGTFFGMNPVDVGPGTVSARINMMSLPPWGCGTWDLNLEATGLDLSSIQSNPISLWLNDSDMSGPFCFDITNAIIGDKINPMPKKGRRGARR